MGWTVLYIAFGIVALWLLGEVLLQYKARLRWRALAFVGFLGVVTGVVLGSVVVIVLGAVAFAVGQTYVTLSFRRGFSTGWALGGKPGASKRRRTDSGRGGQQPTLEVSGMEYEPAPDPAAPVFAAPATPAAPAFDPPAVPGYDGAPPPPHQPPAAAPVYEPEPLPDDTGQYGVYGIAADSDAGYGYPEPPPPAEPAGSDAYGFPQPAPSGPGGYEPAAAAAGAAYAAASAPQAAGYGTGYESYDAYAGYDQQQYGYGTEQQYAPYAADPYPAAAPEQGYPAQPAAPYPPYGGDQQQNTYPPQAPYTGAPYGQETPPGGVWMPPQRGADASFGGDAPQPQQPFPHQGQGGGYGQPAYGDHGYDEQQYRY